MPAYSFKNVSCTLTGPGPAGMVTIPLSQGGVSAEGIKFADSQDKNSMTIGADGTPEHSLNAGKGASAEVSLQHTSSLNFGLQELYNFQEETPGAWGQNTINVADFARGDFHVLRECAFKKQPDEDYAAGVSPRVWMFDVGIRDSKIGPGSPVVS